MNVDLEQEIEDALGDASLEELISTESSARGGQQLESNSRHQGIVIRAHGENVFISLGTGHEGVLPAKQRFAETAKVFHSLFAGDAVARRPARSIP